MIAQTSAGPTAIHLYQGEIVWKTAVLRNACKWFRAPHRRLCIATKLFEPWRKSQCYGRDGAISPFRVCLGLFNKLSRAI